MDPMEQASIDIEKAMDEMRNEIVEAQKALSSNVEARPIHRLEGIRSMQQKTLEQAILHRKEFEATKDTNIAANDANYRRLIDECDDKIARVTETLSALQKEKMTLYAEMEGRRQEIIEKFKADDEALMKIISAQRKVISALGEDDDSSAETGSADSGNDQKQKTVAA